MYQPQFSQRKRRLNRLFSGAAFLTLAACTVFLVLPGTARADLVGDSIDGCFNNNGTSCVTVPNLIPSVIDPGIDKTLVTLYAGGAHTLTTTIDFGPDTLTIRLVNSNPSGGTSSGTGLGFSFSDLDFGGLETITNVVTLQNDFGFNAPTFTADSISSQNPDLFIFTPGMDITSSYRFETVPEPATLSLLAIGGVMLLKRRRA